MLIYCLVKGLPVNVRAILRKVMLKVRTTKRWYFYYGSIVTSALRELIIEEEVHNVCPSRTPHLVYHPTNVTHTKAHNPSIGPVFIDLDRKDRDNIWMGHMFVVDELKLQLVVPY